MGTKLHKSLSELRQKNPTECGVIALEGLYRSEINSSGKLHELRTLAGRVSKGLSIADLEILSTKIGMKTLPVKATLSELISNGSGAIIHLSSHHFVLLAPTKPNSKGYLVFNPAAGLIRMDAAELNKLYTNKALVFIESTPATVDNTPIARPDKVKLRHIVAQLTDFPAGVAPLLLTSVCGTLFQMVTAMFMQLALDRAIPTGSINFLYSLIIVFGAVLDN